MKPLPPHDIVRAVRAELRVPGRYDLNPHIRQRAYNPLQWAVRWIVDRLHDLEHAIASHVHVAPATKSAIGDLIVAVALLTVAFIAARLLLEAQIERAQHGETHTLAISRSAHALNLRAASYAADGEYALAVRTIFAAAVTLLDLRGVVRDEESATVNELRRALHERDGTVEMPFIEIARAYTSAAYAEKPTDADAWELAQRAYGELTQSVRA